MKQRHVEINKQNKQKWPNTSSNNIDAIEEYSAIG